MQLTFLERKVSQRTFRRAARLSANESFPPAPGFSRVSGCPLASALNSRRVAARDNSRPWQLAIARAHRTANARPRPSAWALKSRPWQLAIARAHREASARPRPSAWALNSRPGQLAAARAHQTASARPRPSAWAVNSRPLAARYRSCSSNRQRTSAAQCLGSQFAPWQLAIARAHQAANARARGLHPRQFAPKGGG